MDERIERIMALFNALEAALLTPDTDGMEINEILGTYDGKLLVAREIVDEMKSILFSPNEPPKLN